MSIGVKFADIVPMYRGVGDFSQWVDKLELVADLQQVAKLETFLLLFLADGAFVVYKSLSETIKKDYSQLKSKLLAAFDKDMFSAYAAFISRRLMPDESVDVYCSELSRLASLVASNVPDDFLKAAFINGLAENMKNTLKAANGMRSMSLPEIVERCRSLISENTSYGMISTGTYKKRQHFGGPLKCFSCGKAGRISKFCRGRNQIDNSNIKCFKCGVVGHISKECSRVNEFQDSKNA